jgi:hypothetical protein
MQRKLDLPYAKSLEMRARRRARRLGFYVTKSRCAISLDNFGEFMLVDAQTNAVVGGRRYDWTAADILDYFKNVQ